MFACELGYIAVEMLLAKMVKRAMIRTFQDRPKGFYAVRN